MLYLYAIYLQYIPNSFLISYYLVHQKPKTYLYLFNFLKFQYGAHLYRCTVVLLPTCTVPSWAWCPDVLGARLS